MFGDHEAISTAWPLVSYLISVVSFYRYLFRRLLCLLCEIKALYAAARFCRWFSGPAPCCFFSVVRDSTLPSLANPKISSLTFQLTVLLACRTDRYVRRSITHVILSSYAPINVLPHLPPCGHMTGIRQRITQKRAPSDGISPSGYCACACCESRNCTRGRMSAGRDVHESV